jgi:hypothetical protein
MTSCASGIAVLRTIACQLLTGVACRNLLQAAALGGVPEASPVGCRVLPASTVEQLEAFFDTQLRQVCMWTNCHVCGSRSALQAGTVFLCATNRLQTQWYVGLQ